MVLPVRIELTTSPLPRGCSTTELRQLNARAGGSGEYTRPRRLARRAQARRGAGSGTNRAPPRLVAVAWRTSAIDPITDVAAGSVLAAFEAAQRAGRPSVDCYRAGVDAWRRSHPDQAPEYAAKQAVAVILAAKVSVRVEE
jgi:hypothetical protein